VNYATTITNCAMKMRRNSASVNIHGTGLLLRTYDEVKM